MTWNTLNLSVKPLTQPSYSPLQSNKWATVLTLPGLKEKIQRCCWMLGSSSYICVPASPNWHARHTPLQKRCNPPGDSPVTQPALSPHSPGSPCHSLLGTLFLHAAGKEKTPAAFSPLLLQGGNTLAAQYSMKNYFNYFRGSKHRL